MTSFAFTPTADLLDAFPNLTHLSLLAPLADPHGDESGAARYDAKQRSSGNASSSNHGVESTGWFGGSWGASSRGKRESDGVGLKKGVDRKASRVTAAVTDGMPLIPLGLHRLPLTLEVRL